jgi:methionyl aminopeptidase|tara:strand:+ start:168 stop:947 length:780 start_codon:yes stop_codon:yes gene_type:complete
MSFDYKENFEQMKIAGSLGADTLDEITKHVKPGITTDALDKICYEFIRDNGGFSAPLFYRGFPKSCCTSVNHVICHGIPNSNKYLTDGDIVNIDVTAIVNGWHGDTSRMFYVGDVSVKSRNLVSATYDSMMKAINIIKEGVYLGDLGEIIQTFVEGKGFSVVRDFCGHGIGKIFHQAPNILHYGKKGEGEQLKAGMIFTVEPMINDGLYNTKMLKDGWTAVTKDKSLSAQFEHTVGVTNDGFEIFTKSKKEYTQPPYSI